MSPLCHRSLLSRKSAQNGQLPEFPKSSFFSVRRQVRCLSLSICSFLAENRAQTRTLLSISVFGLPRSIPPSLSPFVTATSPLPFGPKKCPKTANFPTSRRLRSSHNFPFFAQARQPAEVLAPARTTCRCHLRVKTQGLGCAKKKQTVAMGKISLFPTPWNLCAAGTEVQF